MLEAELGPQNVYKHAREHVPPVQFYRRVGLVPWPRADLDDDDEFSDAAASMDSAVRLPSEGVDQVWHIYNCSGMSCNCQGGLQDAPCMGHMHLATCATNVQQG